MLEYFIRYLYLDFGYLVISPLILKFGFCSRFYCFLFILSAWFLGLFLCISSLDATGNKWVIYGTLSALSFCCIWRMNVSINMESCASLYLGFL